MVIIVTGGAGFIGGNYIHYHLKKYPEDRIVCIDKLTYAGNLSTLAPVMDNPNFRFCKLDICDREGVLALFEEEKTDAVINFAAESHVDRSIEDPGIFLQTNIIGTSVMMDACRVFGNVRYHQVSTDEVYGDLPLDRPDLFFTEDTPIHTSSPYSASKAGADLLVQAYYRTYGLPITISRCSNNYGPYHFPEKLIPLMIANCLNDKPLPVYGEGLNVRDWLYVEDHCKAIDLIVRNGRIGEVYNVGGHNEMRNVDIVKLIIHIKVSYAHLNYLSDFDVDVYGSGALINEQGCTAQIAFGMDNEYRCELEVWGSKGLLTTGRILTAPAGFTPTVKIKKGQNEQIIDLPEDDAFQKSIECFIRCIDDEKYREQNNRLILQQAEILDQFMKKGNL